MVEISRGTRIWGEVDAAKFVVVWSCGWPLGYMTIVGSANRVIGLRCASGVINGEMILVQELEWQTLALLL